MREMKLYIQKKKKHSQIETESQSQEGNADSIGDLFEISHNLLKISGKVLNRSIFNSFSHTRHMFLLI